MLSILCSFRLEEGRLPIQIFCYCCRQLQFFEQRRKLLAEKPDGRRIRSVPCWRNQSKSPEHLNDHPQVLQKEKVVRRDLKVCQSDNPTLQEQSLDILGLELLCPKEKPPTESSSENSGPSLGKSRKGKPRTISLGGVKGYEILQRIPERDSSTTGILPQEVLPQATQAEKSINIPRESLSSQPSKAAEALANSKDCFRVLDILSDNNEDEFKQRPSTEPYAFFPLKGYERAYPSTPENLPRSSPISVPSQRDLAKALSRVETVPGLEVAEQELQISELQLQRNRSYNSPKVSNASWWLPSQGNPKRIASPRLDFMRIQDTIARRPESGNLDISPQYRARKSSACFLETSWNVPPVTPNLRFRSLNGLKTDWSPCQYSEHMSPNLENVQSWSSDVLEVDNPAQSCQFGTEARSISEDSLLSFEDALGSLDSNSRDQENVLGTFECGAKGGTAPDECLTILEDMESWDLDVLNQVNSGTMELSSRSKDGSKEGLANFEELVEFEDPNFLEQKNTVGTIQLGSKARAESEESLRTFQDDFVPWHSDFLIQGNSTGSSEMGLAAKSCSEERFQSFEDEVKPWESNFLELDNPGGSCEVRSIRKTCPDESVESFADVGSWESDFLEQNDSPGICRLGSKDRPTSPQMLPLFDDVGSSDSGFLSEDYPAGPMKLALRQNKRDSTFGIFASML